MAVQDTNVYDVGQEVRSTVVFAIAGVATDPTTIIFRYRDPSGNVTSSTFGVPGSIVVNDAVGNYHADWILDEEGRWYYRWEGTGAVDAAAEHNLEVRDSLFTA